MAESLSQAMTDLNEEKVKELIKKEIKAGTPAIQILRECQKGMVEIGKKYEAGTYFVSELMYAGEIMKEITAELKNSLTGKSKLGRGGIQSKIKAAEIATSCGIPVIIANSRRENVLLDVLAGKGVGTFFKPQSRMPAVKRWIAYGAAAKGIIYVNAGAKKAILEGSSLLAVGVTKVVGIFDVGDVVSIEDENNVEFARGNPNYNSSQLNLIKGLQVTEVHKKLGADKPKEVIIRRNIHLNEEEK